MADVVFDHVNIRYPGADAPTVKDLNLEIADGEFLVLVGPSGCGKSTTLRALAGLEPTDSGIISIGGRDVTGEEPGDRDIAMVFQDYALYPHMSVRENMGFALTIKKRPKSEIAERVERAAEILDLTEFLDRKPKDLSGGQRQRVAMGRAIVREPQVFLMDEPLSNLDAKLRVQTRAQIVKLQQNLDVTTVYVTHDQVEAMTMGHRVAVLKDGILQQVDTPQNLYRDPVNAFVAGFIGSPSMNLLTVDGSALTELGIDLPAGAVQVGVRPEHLTVQDAGTPGLVGTVSLVEELGSDANVYAETFYGQVTARTEDAPGTLPPLGGSVVFTLAEGAAVYFFDAEGERVR
ncbi:ABC transporter ATP-binding protein [Corynebacterium variabile]|uniref:Trehalose import ATP-binding protein SugC n=3 Tax=Corynebacterium variabile TaxID=1727 RepID=A0A110BG80_9CORY|nr:ATP-binding cassette domain-containing protein [Corynebacterium variabile]AEK37545.1 sugar ABC transport system subunit [Corynebacterium variabile DSM 44702]MDN6241460.1 ATP-binding cassette domain-containing protein [Corynebacterium variabile]MDN6478115.1 ATP-binding cassette domain-containing protein [Corynebacterium variabile]MDN6675506.1 ATP-binding cassette domain-containing protein [Corynebacterium variabile]MDN6845619.1 ATP-binding cassette domain-containing protein [Corynebacterium 